MNKEELKEAFNKDLPKGHREVDPFDLFQSVLNFVYDEENISAGDKYNLYISPRFRRFATQWKQKREEKD